MSLKPRRGFGFFRIASQSRSGRSRPGSVAPPDAPDRVDRRVAERRVQVGRPLLVGPGEVHRLAGRRRHSLRDEAERGDDLLGDDDPLGLFLGARGGDERHARSGGERLRADGPGGGRRGAGGARQGQEGRGEGGVGEEAAAGLHPAILCAASGPRPSAAAESDDVP